MICLKDGGIGTIKQMYFLIELIFSLPTWPPENFDYSEALMNNKLRLVDFM